MEENESSRFPRPIGNRRPSGEGFSIPKKDINRVAVGPEKGLEAMRTIVTGGPVSSGRT